MNKLKRLNKYFVTCLILLFSQLSFASEDVKRLLISISSQLPPYTIDHEKKTGIDPELISMIMDRAGYEVKFLPTPSKRQNIVINRPEVDASTGWTIDNLSGCHLSKPYRYWLNVLIVPHDSDIKGLSDLKGKRLAVFQGAENYIDDFTEITKGAELILESASSLQAGRLVYGKRVDAYLGDYTGYYYSVKMEYGKEKAEKLTHVKYYFDGNPQRICFKDELIRDQFDQILTELIEEKTYQQIYDKYSPGFSAHFFHDSE